MDKLLYTHTDTLKWLSHVEVKQKKNKIENANFLLPEILCHLNDVAANKNNIHTLMKPVQRIVCRRDLFRCESFPGNLRIDGHIITLTSPSLAAGAGAAATRHRRPYNLNTSQYILRGIRRSMGSNYLTLWVQWVIVFIFFYFVFFISILIHLFVLCLLIPVGNFMLLLLDSLSFPSPAIFISFILLLSLTHTHHLCVCTWYGSGALALRRPRNRCHISAISLCIHTLQCSTTHQRKYGGWLCAPSVHYIMR